MSREETTEIQLDFSKIQAMNLPVIPVVVQHATTKDILILAYVNDTALAESIRTKIATFWSTSRNELWVKGKTSGDTLALRDILVNCEQNSLAFLVEPTQAGVCHSKDATGQTRSTCYYRRVDGEQLAFLNR